MNAEKIMGKRVGYDSPIHRQLGYMERAIGTTHTRSLQSPVVGSFHLLVLDKHGITDNLVSYRENSTTLLSSVFTIAFGGWDTACNTTRHRRTDEGETEVEGRHQSADGTNRHATKKT